MMIALYCAESNVNYIPNQQQIRTTMKSYAAGICRHQKFEKCFINEHTHIIMTE